MSSYKNKSGNRIPGNSVTISNQPYLVKVEEIITEDFFTDQERDERVKKSKVELKDEQLKRHEMKLKEYENKLQREYEVFEKEKADFLTRFREEEEKYEKRKRQEYYDMREFMWEYAIKLSEEIVGQKVKSEDFSIKDMFTNLIKKLPIAFEELTITINPETLEFLKNDVSSESWILNNINWKLDYNLQTGEFIVEDEKEYYDYRFSSLFNEIKRRINNLNQHIRSEDEQ